MRKVVIYIAMSLDGYVADKNGGVDFLQGDGSDSNNMGSFPEFFENVGDVIMGYTTYNQVITELAPDNYPYTGKKSYVFTSKNLTNTDEVFFTSQSVEALITERKASSDEGLIWINGGSSIVNQVLKANLANEVIVSIIPTILGGGIKLFQDSSIEQKLTFKDSSVSNGIVEVRYEMR